MIIHRKRHRLKAVHGQSVSVILLISVVSFQLNNILLCTICDRQRSVLRLNRVVLRFRVIFQLVGERVLARANHRLASCHVIRRAFFSNKAVAAYIHIVVRQRRAVVDLAVRSGGQLHRARVDRQAAVIRLRNDIFLRLIYRANGTFRKLSFICSSVRSLRANFDRAEISVFRRSGKAGNTLLFSIINLRVALRRQRDVLIIVEVKNVCIFIRRNGDGFSRCILEGVATIRRKFLFFRRDYCAFICRTRLSLERLVTTNPVVVHRVAQVGNPIVEDFYFRRDVIKSMGFSQIRIVRRNLILFSIFCDGFGNVLVSRSICSGCPFSAFYIHAIFDLFPGSSILKDKLVRGLNSLNFDKDVQVPCGDSIAYIVIRTITGLKTTIIPVKPRLGILYRDIQIVPMMEVSTCNKRYRISRGSITTGFALVIIRVTSAYPWRRHIYVINISNRIPTASVGLHVTRFYAFNLCININLIRYGRMRCRNLLLIPAAGNPIRQRPHRHQIDEHQRRHQNGYKAFYFIPHCLILLFHLEAALPLLPERSKRICGQTVRRLKKRFGKNGRVIPARRFPPPRRALRVQPLPRARQPPRVRRPRASARSGQRGDSSN